MSVELDADVAAAVEDVDSVKRVVGMADDWFVFFQPVERPEIKQNMAGKVGVVGAEGD